MNNNEEEKADKHLHIRCKASEVESWENAARSTYPKDDPDKKANLSKWIKNILNKAANRDIA